MIVILDKEKMSRVSKWLPSPSGLLVGVVIMFVGFVSVTGGDIILQLQGHAEPTNFLSIPELGEVDALLLVLFGLWVGFVPTPVNIWLVNKFKKVFRGEA